MAWMNIQRKTTTRKFPLNVLKNSHHSPLLPLSESLLFTNVITVHKQNATQFFFLAVAPVLSKFPSFLKFSNFFCYCLANTFIAKCYFIFICVQSSLRQFYLPIEKLLFDCSLSKSEPWMLGICLNVNSLTLFSLLLENDRKMTGKYHFWW